MQTQELNRLLQELTPEIRAYLFPGLPEPPPVEQPDFSGSGCGFDSFDFDFGLPSVVEPAPEPREEAATMFRIELGEAKTIRESRKAARMQAPASGREREPRITVPLDPRTERIIADIHRLQEKYGVSIEELEAILNYTVRLSPLHISRNGRIVLSGYDGREVRMSDLPKALYFLYLRHPEGLRFKDVADHRAELLQLYEGITGRDDPEEIGRSIDLLVDPLGNALNVNASRIKAAFRNVVSDRIARFYYLNGPAGEPKKVPLDRDLVIWEY